MFNCTILIDHCGDCFLKHSAVDPGQVVVSCYFWRHPTLSKPLHVSRGTRSAGFNLLTYIDLSKANKPWGHGKSS